MLHNTYIAFVNSHLFIVCIIYQSHSMLPNLCCETVSLYSLIILIVSVFNNRSILCCFSNLLNLCPYIGNEHIKGNCGAGI